MQDLTNGAPACPSTITATTDWFGDHRELRHKMRRYGLRELEKKERARSRNLAYPFLAK